MFQTFGMTIFCGDWSGAGGGGGYNPSNIQEQLMVTRISDKAGGFKLVLTDLTETQTDRQTDCTIDYKSYKHVYSLQYLKRRPSPS